MPTCCCCAPTCSCAPCSSKERTLNSLMREEALSAADAVARQLQADDDRLAELDGWLARHPPQATVTIARGSSDHAAAYFGYLSALHAGRLVTSLSLSLLTLYGAP